MNVTHNATRVSVTCRSGGEIDIRASRVHLTATGQCAEVDVQGTANVVVLDQASRISSGAVTTSATARAHRPCNRSAARTRCTALPPRAPPVRRPPAVVLTISGSAQIKNFACHNRILRLNGDSNQLTITGHCASISVTGDSNQLTVDSVNVVHVNGTSNRVVYHSGNPTVTKPGFANSVERG